MASFLLIMQSMWFQKSFNAIVTNMMQKPLTNWKHKFWSKPSDSNVRIFIFFYKNKWYSFIQIDRVHPYNTYSKSLPIWLYSSHQNTHVYGFSTSTTQKLLMEFFLIKANLSTRIK